MPYVRFFLHSIAFSKQLVVHFPGPDNLYKVTRSQLLRLPPSTLSRDNFLCYLNRREPDSLFELELSPNQPVNAFRQRKGARTIFKTPKEKLRGLRGTPSKKAMGNVNGEPLWAKAYAVTGYVPF